MKKPDADSDDSIRKLLGSMYGEEIDEKIDAKFADIKSEMLSIAKTGKDSDIVPLIYKLRETSERLARLEASVEKHMSAQRKPIEPDDMLSALRPEMEKLTTGLKEETAKCKDRIKDMQMQVAGINESFSEMREMHNALKGIDARGIMREIESLKQKLAWLEQSQQPHDIEALKDRLDEMDSHLKNIRLGSALVIE